MGFFSMQTCQAASVLLTLTLFLILVFGVKGFPLAAFLN